MQSGQNIIEMHENWLYNILYSGVIRNCISLLAEKLHIYPNKGVLRLCIFNYYSFNSEFTKIITI